MNSVCRGSSIATSTACGSLTLTIMSEAAKTAARVGQDASALRDVLVVGDRGALARSGLDQHLMAVLDQLAHSGRRERDAVLVRLDLGGDADLHLVPFGLDQLPPPQGEPEVDAITSGVQ